MKTPPELDRIADVVLNYRPKPKTKAQKKRARKAMRRGRNGERSMAKIEWTDRTWNPTRGCSLVSEGCRNCYAERQAARFVDGPFAGFVAKVNGHPAWTGKVELRCRFPERGWSICSPKFGLYCDWRFTRKDMIEAHCAALGKDWSYCRRKGDRAVKVIICGVEMVKPPEGRRKE